MEYKINLKEHGFFKINIIINFILAFIFFPPELLKVDYRFQSLYKYINYGSWFLSIYILFICGIFYLCSDLYLGKTKKVIGAKSLFLILFFFVLIFSTIINGDSAKSILIVATKVLALDLLLYCLYCWKRHLYFLRDLYIYLFIMIACNLLSQVLIPNGIVEPNGVNWQPYFICSNANSFVYVYIFALAVGSILELKLYNKIRIDVYLLWGIEFVSMLMGGTSTGLVAVLLAGMYLLVIVRMPIKKLLKRFRVILTILICIFVYFIYFNNANMLSNSIKMFTGEDSSYSARIYIWQIAVEQIKLHPLLGYGTGTSNLAYDASGLARSGHNNYLQVLLQGGFIALSVYVLFVYRSLADIIKEKVIVADISFLIVYFALIYMIVFFFEQNPIFIGFYSLLLLSRVLETNDLPE
jgi:O-antigen ligase